MDSATQGLPKCNVSKQFSYSDILTLYDVHVMKLLGYVMLRFVATSFQALHAAFQKLLVKTIVVLSTPEFFWRSPLIL